MTPDFTPLHSSFVAQASPIALREAFEPAVLDEIRTGMERHAVLVFRDQEFSDDEHLDFARRFDGVLHEKPGSLVIYDNRATMHRARPFEDGIHRRELRRVTTLDIDI